MRNSLLLIFLLPFYVYAISHGEVIKDDVFPSAIKVKIKLKGDSNSFCSGVFISNNVVLTAAHCLLEAREVYIDINKVEYLSKTFTVNPSYIKAKKNGENKDRFDIGLIFFKDLLVTDFSDISYEILEQDEIVDFVGYGTAALSFGLDAERISYFYQQGFNNIYLHTKNTRRRGRNKILTTHKYPYSEYINFESINVTPLSRKDKFLTIKEALSGTNPGDSGGPVYKNNEIVGIISGTAWAYKCLPEEICFDLNRATKLSLNENKSFIEEYLESIESLNN